MMRIRRLSILGAALAGAGLAASCSKIIGADFDVVLEDAGPTPDGGSGGGGGGGSGGTGGNGGTGGSGGMGCGPEPCMPEPVASGEESPWGIAASGDWVYWVTNAGSSPTGTLKRSRISAPGSNQQLVKNLVSPNQLAVDAAHVYWTSSAPSGAVYCIPLDGAGTPQTLAVGQAGPIGILVDASNVYWTTADGHVRSTPAGCGPTAPTAGEVASGFISPSLLARKDNELFVTEYANPGRVMRMPTGGGLAASLVDKQDTPNGIVDRGDDICFATAVVNGAIYCSTTTAGAAMLAPVATKQNIPAGLTVDRSNGTLYWANSGDGTIMKLELGAAQPTQVASGQAYPNGIAVGGSYVYWTNHAPKGQGGSVMRIRIH